MSSQAAGPRPATAPRAAGGTAVGTGRLRAQWRSRVTADARTAQAPAHPVPAARLHTDICY